ncbi:PEBP-like protein [Coprinopsis marcescibilis]|uniref:PEBP-like protein n=1 Tax=Coprinopsis marcescibilis TaxID=230819 RepID=A0A5C3KR99_COPMA|nr:PEBP-like protein [Coprinopsis marcescibilis]
MKAPFALLGSILALAPSLIAAQDRSVKDVVAAFEKAGIPEDLAIKFQPSSLLEVSFPQAAGRAITLKAGVQLPRNVTAGPPTYRLLTNKLIDRGPFVIASVDPDAPTPQDPTVAQIRHGLAGNFYLSNFGSSRGGLKNKTSAITEWLQPNPPSYSDAHRYIFLIYRQPEGFNEQKLVTPETTVRLFNISSFASAVGLGDPIAGTFMVVAPDPPAA